jgi:hypothetical protein
MTDALGAAKSERTTARLGYRAGYYSRTLITRVGKLELCVPQDRDGRFSTELFERYQRSEQALVATLAEMYVQGWTAPLSTDPKGQGRHGGAVWPCLRGLGDLRHQPTPGQEPDGLCPAAAGGAVRLPDPRCALREGA